MTRSELRWVIGMLALAMLGCGGGEAGGEADTVDREAAATLAGPAPAQEAFFTRLEALCGRAFRGEATLASSDGFDGEMIMHVRRCTPDEIQIPLHIGENRSRTWIVTRTARATFEFDLTDEVAPPPAPWGYEGS